MTNSKFEKFKKFQVQPEHLVGEIADFPLHVVQAMVNEQVRQHGEADISVFVMNNWAGFNWHESSQGHRFWRNVILEKQFYRVPEPENVEGHPYASLMEQYSEDARVSKTPWDKWECKVKNLSMWQPLETHPRWDDEFDYRRKPESNPVDEQTALKPNDIVRTLLARDIEVWGGCSDHSYRNARAVAKVQLSKIEKYSKGYIKSVEGKYWKYVVPIDPKTMTEITEI